jgi:hypothetical protein
MPPGGQSGEQVASRVGQPKVPRGVRTGPRAGVDRTHHVERATILETILRSPGLQCCRPARQSGPRKTSRIGARQELWQDAGQDSRLASEAEPPLGHHNRIVSRRLAPRTLAIAIRRRGPRPDGRGPRCVFVADGDARGFVECAFLLPASASATNDPADTLWSSGSNVRSRTIRSGQALKPAWWRSLVGRGPRLYPP